MATVPVGQLELGGDLPTKLPLVPPKQRRARKRETPLVPDPLTWRPRAWAAVEALAARGRTFGADDVRARGTGEPTNPQAWGGLFASAHRQGLIKPVAAGPSTRRERHSGLNRLWVGMTWTDR